MGTNKNNIWFDGFFSPFSADLPNRVVATNSQGYSQATDVTYSELQAVANGGAGVSYLTAKSFGAKGDAKFVTDAVVNAGSNILTSATANFTIHDVGKVIAIPYAGADNGVLTVGRSLVTTIQGFTNSTTVTLATNAIKSIVGTRTLTDVSMTAGSNTVTSATANFTATDVGKTIVIAGAGTPDNNAALPDAPQKAYIYKYISSTQVLVNRFAVQSVTNATTTITGAWAQWGTDDTVSLQTAFNYASENRIELVLDTGRYLITSHLVPQSYLKVRGFGAGNSIIAPVGGTETSAIRQENGGAPTIDQALTDIHLENFEIDGMGVTVNTYNTRSKGLYIRPMIRPVITKLYIHDTSATGMGIDFLINYTITDNVIEHCGRQLNELNNVGDPAFAGGSGIGIGTGILSEECGIISGNVTIDNGNYGIFIEGQRNGIVSTGHKIAGNTSMWNLQGGIGDLGCNGTIVSENHILFNPMGLRADGAPFLTPKQYGKNGHYLNNVIKNNLNGIYVETQELGHRISGNILSSDYGYQGSDGIRVLLYSGGSTVNDLRIENNTVIGFSTKGIRLESGDAPAKYGNVLISKNIVYNTGVLTSDRKAGIRSDSNIANYIVVDNIAFDTRTVGSKTQSYGLLVAAGSTIDAFTYWNNQFKDNADGLDNLSGTITAKFLKPDLTLPNTWTGANTYSALSTFNGDALFVGQFNIDSDTALSRISRYSSTPAQSPGTIFTRSRGSKASPSDIVAGDILGKTQIMGRVGGTPINYGFLGFTASDTLGNGTWDVYASDLVTRKVVIDNNTGAISGGQFKVNALNAAPATSSSTGTLGEIRITATAIYVCTATNTWVKANLSTF